MSSNCPCKDCSDRSALCHSRCDLYKSWRAEKDVINAKVRKYKYEQALLNSYRMDTLCKANKHRHCK